MDIRNDLCAIIGATTLGLLAMPAAAVEPPRDACKPDDAKITSSTIVVDGWYVGGICLSQVTNVALAREDGAGFEEITFEIVKNPANLAAQPGLHIKRVTRVSPVVDGIPVGQYLMQAKKCEKVKPADKCKILDEKYLFVLDVQPQT